MSRVEEVFSVEYLQTLKGIFGFFEPREMLRSFEVRWMFGCISRTVLYAKELISIYI